VLVLTLLAVALCRLVAWDRVQVFALADAFGALLYLPAWGVGLWAALGRRWALLGVSVVVVVAQLGFSLPELTAATQLPAMAGHAPTFRLYDANVYQKNDSMAGYAAQLRELRPDLVTLEEASPTDRQQLEVRGALRTLPNFIEVTRYDSHAFLIASRYRFTAPSLSTVDGLPFLVRTSLLLPAGAVPLWVVHITAPVGPGWQLWNRQLARVCQLLRIRRPGPILLVGDFNSTWGNRWFHAILDTGLTDGASARGEPFAMTWSQMFFLLPPLIRIDHVLTGPGLEVSSIRTEPGPGSDHRALLASVAVLFGARGSGHVTGSGVAAPGQGTVPRFDTGASATVVEWHNVVRR